MGIRVNNPVQSLFAQRQTENANQRLARGLGQLASGLRITSAGVDAAGLAIAERFDTQVRQFNQEANSLQTGINAAQTAESALSVQGDAVQRIRELAVQSANGTLSNEQRAGLNEEAQQLVQQIEQVAQSTEFNGRRLLNGSTGTVTLDPAGAQQLTFPDSTSGALGVAGIDLSTEAGATAALGVLDAATTQISSNRATLGAQENGLATAINQRSDTAVNLADAESRIRDLDVARASVDQVRNQLLSRAGISGILRGNIESQTALTLLGG